MCEFVSNQGAVSADARKYATLAYIESRAKLNHVTISQNLPGFHGNTVQQARDMYWSIVDLSCVNSLVCIDIQLNVGYG